MSYVLTEAGRRYTLFTALGQEVRRNAFLVRQIEFTEWTQMIAYGAMERAPERAAGSKKAGFR